MILLDVNVLVYAFDRDSVEHTRSRRWLEDALVGDEPVGVTDVVLSGFLRVATHPAILVRPAPIETAMTFATAVRAAPSCLPLAPGERHWSIFVRLCRTAGVAGNRVPDAYLAALAIEAGAELLTYDRGFARYPGLRWRTPAGAG